MNEITITTNKMAQAGGAIHVWGWEVPVYLFLGGLTAGILILSAFMILRNKGKDFDVATNKIVLLAPVFLSLGMLALFLDLEHKLYVWRFYTAFNITSPMSWGSWILLLVYPLSFLLILATFRQGFPKSYSTIESFIEKRKKLAKHVGKFRLLFEWSEKHSRLIAKITIPVAILLGIYTGILLSALGARPFWNSAIMGPIFLVSGVSTAAALVILLSPKHQEVRFFTRVDLGLIGVEAVLLVLFIIGMATSSTQHQEALGLILGGPLTAVFWVLIMGMGLMLPAFLETLELKGKQIPSFLGAGFVLLGGLLLRFIIVEAGQLSSWLPY
jgi:formate-dependent nitrite reductase membrane component NrfD